MSTNCIVKKYKGEVNDNNLPFYGRVKIYFDQIESASNLSSGIRRNADMFKDGKVEVVGDVYFANSSLQSLGVKELGVSYIDPFYVTNGKGVLLLSDSVENIMAIAGASSYAKAYYVKMDEFREVSSLQRLQIGNSTKSEGDIINLAQCIGLTSLAINNTNIEGSISDLVISQIDNYGRTSGTITINANSKLTTYGTTTTSNDSNYTVNITDSTHFNIVSSSYTVAFTKSGGVWSYEVTT